MIQVLGHPSKLTNLRVRDKGRDHPVQVVEEGKKIEGQFEPSFSRCPRQFISIHNRSWIIESCPRHDRSVKISMDMIGNERDVDQERNPFSCDQEKQVEENVDKILRQDQRIKSITLIDRILEVRLQFVKSDDMEDSEEDEEGIQNQSQDVGKGCESKPHI